MLLLKKFRELYLETFSEVPKEKAEEDLKKVFYLLAENFSEDDVSNMVAGFRVASVHYKKLGIPSTMSQTTSNKESK